MPSVVRTFSSSALQFLAELLGCSDSTFPTAGDRSSSQFSPRLTVLETSVADIGLDIPPRTCPAVKASMLEVGCLQKQTLQRDEKTKNLLCQVQEVAEKFREATASIHARNRRCGLLPCYIRIGLLKTSDKRPNNDVINSLPLVRRVSTICCMRYASATRIKMALVLFRMVFKYDRQDRLCWAARRGNVCCSSMKQSFLMFFLRWVWFHVESGSYFSPHFLHFDGLRQARSTYIWDSCDRQRSTTSSQWRHQSEVLNRRLAGLSVYNFWEGLDGPYLMIKTSRTSMSQMEFSVFTVSHVRFCWEPSGPWMMILTKRTSVSSLERWRSRRTFVLDKGLAAWKTIATWRPSHLFLGCLANLSYISFW